MVVSPQASPSSSSWSPWVLPQHSWLHRPSMKSCSASPHHKNPKFRSPPARHTQAYITFFLTTRTHTLTGSQVVHAPHLSTIAAQTPDSHRGKSRRDREGVSSDLLECALSRQHQQLDICLDNVHTSSLTSSHHCIRIARRAHHGCELYNGWIESCMSASQRCRRPKLSHSLFSRCAVMRMQEQRENTRNV